LNGNAWEAVNNVIRKAEGTARKRLEKKEV
jgi:hypothetical protein